MTLFKPRVGKVIFAKTTGGLSVIIQKKKKKWERKCFDQVDLWPWPKSQNFQNRPVPLKFSSTFWFWDPFVHSKLRNCANVQFPKVDFCTNIDQMSKILRWTYLSQFFAYIPILESVSSFKTWKLHKWLNSKVVDFWVEVDLKSRFSSQTCLAQFFVTWKPPIWPTSLKY